MDTELEPRLVEILHHLGLNEQTLRDHVLRPETPLHDALQIELHEAGEGHDDPAITPPPPGWFYRLNVPKLQRELHELLALCTVGFSMQLRRYGRVLFSEQFGYAKIPGDVTASGEAWTSGTPMHVASVSKLFTAMAMTRVLDYYNISPDSSISQYLPAYWSKGPGVDQITFRNLLTHKSGLVVPGAPGACDYLFMKDRIAHGVSGMPEYLNINYSLCRILISTIDAGHLFNLLPTTNDTYWDSTTSHYYFTYVNDNIFAPAGVSSTLDHPDHNALAYTYPPMLPSFNSGDQKARCGAVGWHLSVDELLSVMAVFRRSGRIIDREKAERMLDRGFGLDVIKDTPLGRIYAKGGFWSDRGCVEQSNVFFLPKGMELAILANSPFCKPDTAFMGNVLGIIENNIESNLLSLTTTAGAVALLGLFLKGKKIRRGTATVDNALDHSLHDL